MAEIVSGNELRCLIIGCGAIGVRHLKNLLALNVGKIIAFDTSEKCCQAIRSQFSIEVANNLDDAWACHPDVVFITVPTYLHIPLCLEAVQRGCHVFIEKPISHSVQSADSLLSAAEENDVFIQVGHIERFNPAVARVKEYLKSRQYGELIRLEFYREHRMPAHIKDCLLYTSPSPRDRG